jgi:xanthine dehydrogenase YagR molybdenum-binding subunit
VSGTPNPDVGRPLQPLRDDRIHHNGQPIAVVIADTFEHARDAAALVRTHYHEAKAVTDFATAAANAFPPAEMKGEERNTRKPKDYQRGDPDKALADADVHVGHRYTIPAEHHNPMEPHATIAVWDGPKLTQLPQFED